MAKKLYVGNLSYNLTNEDLKEAFGAHGEVVSAKIITDMNTGRSKGFAFVEMASDEGGDKAIAELDGKELDGRGLRVSEAKPQENRPRGGGGDRPRFGGGGGGRSGGGGGYGGGGGGGYGGGGGGRGDRGGNRGGGGGDRY